MYSILLNDISFKLSSFNRSTSYDENKNVISQGQIFLINENSIVSQLQPIIEDGLHSIVIKEEDREIYNSGTIDATINEIDENFISGQILINIKLMYNM